MDTFLHQLRELWHERGRLGLVVLGVVWGTLSLTILLAFGSEFARTTRHTAASLGPGLLRVGHGATTMPYRGLLAGRSVGPVPDDAEAILAGVPGVDGVAYEYIAGGNPLEYDGQKLNVTLIGCNPSFGELRRQRPLPGGRFLNERDEREHRRVVFLGGRTKENLFGDRDAVGETVELWDFTFTVVGVLVPKITASNYSGEDRDKVMIPASTFHDLFGRDTVSALWVRFADTGAREPVKEAVFRVLAARKDVHPEDRDAIWTMDYVEIEEMIDLIVDGNHTFMVVVGVIGLLVAMLGVANVTYSLVEERTREIGVQMALGARPRDLAMERLMESILVTLVGGLVGIAASVGVLELVDLGQLPDEVRAYVGHPKVSLAVAATVVAALTLSGCLAGWVPARRAAAMNPVEALHEE